MVTLLKTVVRAQVGPLQRQTGRVYVHDIELDGDENLTLGQRVEILDEGNYTAVRITEVEQSSEGNRYQLTLEP
jgi:hypothetical protein